MKLYLEFSPLIYLFLYLSYSFSYGVHVVPHNANRCLVNTPSGSYRGSLMNTSILEPNVSYCSYRDIRYGEAVNRFGKPTLVKPEASRTFDATRDEVKCAQSSSTATSEDCLFLNVFTPQTDGKKGQQSRAVMVSIHGGAFTLGSKSSSEFSPDYLLPHGVVLVTINYRLGPFGFLNLGIPECNGNMGLRDQIVALEWIQRNIESFGGDPKNVTLMGQSVGAISVFLLHLSPLAQGLFDKAIIESAITADVFVKTADITEHHSIELAKFLGYGGDPRDRLSILDFLRSLNATSLVEGYNLYYDVLAKTDDLFFYTASPMWPYHDCEQPDAVLPSSLEQLGSFSDDIPCIIGYNNADADAYAVPYDAYVIVDYVSKHWELYLSGIDPAFAKNKQTLEAVIANVTKFYDSSSNNGSKLDDTIRMLTYFTFDDFYEKIALFRPSYARNKIWVYEFVYGDGFDNYKKILLGSEADEVKGASHSGELEYLFYAPQFHSNGFNATKTEKEIIRKMSTWWTNFAKFGNPNSPHDDIVLEWEPTSPVKNNYLLINETITFIRNQKIQQKERDFFDKVREWARNN